MKSPFLDTALEAASAAGDIIRQAYRGKFKVRYKADASPVTEVDEAAEAAIKKILRRKFHGHGFYGEESGKDHADAEYLWLVDPIDGTKAFVRGYPIFSVQIALMHKGELILGVSHAPCWGEGETLHAERGRGAWRGTERLRVSDVNILDIAALAVIVREAGGTFTDLGGKPVGLATKSVLATNGQLHELVRKALARRK